MADWLFHISNAKVQSFRNCRKQYWFRYVSGRPWPQSPMTEAGIIGTGVHTAMHWLTATDDIDIGLQELDAYLRMPAHESVGPGTGSYQTAFDLYSRGCSAHESLAESSEMARSELSAEARWSGGGIIAAARIDRADRVNATRFRIIDWKTGNYDEDLDTDLQLDISHAALRSAWDLGEDVSVEAIAWNLRLERRRVRELRRDDAATTMRKLRAVAKTMEEADEFEATPSRLCSFCDWLPQCEEGQAREWVDADDEVEDPFD